MAIRKKVWKPSQYKRKQVSELSRAGERSEGGAKVGLPKKTRQTANGHCARNERKEKRFAN